MFPLNDTITQPDEALQPQSIISPPQDLNQMTFTQITGAHCALQFIKLSLCSLNATTKLYHQFNREVGTDTE